MSLFRRRVFVLTLLAGAIAPLASQNQPPTAVNQQDEVINIALAPGESAEDAIEILRSGSKFETNDYVTEAIEVKNTAAYELMLTVQQAIAQERGVVRGAITRPTDGSASRQFLVVTTTPLQMDSIRATIAALDIPSMVSSQGRSRQAVRTKYRRASEVAELLRNTRLTSIGRVVADDRTNTLYFDDSVFVMRAAADYLTFYDVPAPQIEFDVQIIEVREDNMGKVGLDWDAWKRTIGGQFALTANQFEGGEGFARLDTLLTLDAAALANFLNYTVESGNANMLQRSRLNASNLEAAVISDLRRIPYFDQVRTERTPAVVTEVNPRADSAGTRDEDEPATTAPRVVTIVPPVTNRITDLSSEEEGLLISIEPIITTDSVQAEIDVAMNTVTGYDRLDRPVVTEQNLTNRVTLQDQAQLLLGTLERQRTVEARRGIPGLKDLPVLKYLFGVETRRTERSRLFILATPRFSNVTFDARSLEDLDSTPTLTIRESDPVLNDGVMVVPDPEKLLGE